MAGDVKMLLWCAQYSHHPRVLAWLKRCPPPKEWRGSPAEWAYQEMPLAPGTFVGEIMAKMGMA